jgi:alpha-L-fucosidase 2
MSISWLMRRIAAVAAAGLAAALAAPAQARDMTLWYDEPAASWETQSLPIGNGALGAAIFGGVDSERVQFNEKTLWTGGPGSLEGYTFGNWEQQRPGAIEEVQRRLDEQVEMEPPAVAQLLGQPKKGYGAYQTFGDVRLQHAGEPGPVEEYRRELDIERAVARVTYRKGGVRYTREYFASRPDGAIVMRLSADQPRKIGFTASVTTPGNRSRSVTASGGRITVAGALSDNGLRYESQLQVTADGGTRSDGADGSVTVADADAAVLVLSAGTNYADRYPDYRGADPHARVTAAVDAAAAKPCGVLLASHERDHRELFDRVRLDIGQAMPAIPTDDLLRRYRGGASAADRALEALYFQFGRYLLIASSRPGSLPANLQGVWNESTSPPWSADYHVNINLQMNYWPAEVTNLSETTGPLFDYIDALRPPGRVTAREMFGARGWVVHNETTPYGFTGVHDWPTAFWFPEAGAWLAQHLYEHYLFMRDESFLRERAYPVMKELAQFWLDELVVDPRDGTLVVSPSYSPEHGPFSAGAAMSQQIVWDLFANVVEASARVPGEGEFRDEVGDALARLDPGTRIGSWGQLQEWKEDWDSPTDDHRHVSHLFGLHPGRQFSPLTEPELAEAAAVTLRGRGDGGTGWSKAWKINFWARLLDGDHAHKMLSEQLRTSTLPNLWDTHPPFQIDGNFGATAGVAEMLLQSHTGELQVLPALPSAWSKGSVSGLRARGDVTVDIRWSGGTADEIELRAGRSGPLTVRSDLFAGRFRMVDAGTGRVVETSGGGSRVTFRAEAGRRYVATSQVNVTVQAPEMVEPGEEAPVEVTVSASGSHTVPAGRLSLALPEGWSARPADVNVLPLKFGQSRTYAFTVTAGDDDDGWTRIRAVLSGDDWRTAGLRRVQVVLPPPCPVPDAGAPLAAWDPASGDVVDDASPHGRDATVQGGAVYTADGPTGSALALDGTRFLRTAPTSLGFLHEATFAAEVKATTTGSYRRLFDFQPVGNPGTDGVLLDLTPSNQLRFIGSGVNVTTSATVPSGRFVDLVVTMADDGEIAVFVDGRLAGGAFVPDGGIVGCATRELRFAANQNGTERLTGEVDRMAIFARALPEEDVRRWQSLAFG